MTEELTLMDAQSKFHCASNYTFHQVEDQLQQGVEELETIRDRVEDVPDTTLNDLDTIIEIAKEVSDSERPLSDAEDVALILEYGLAWGIEDPDECPGYAPSCQTVHDRFDLQMEVA